MPLKVVLVLLTLTGAVQGGSFQGRSIHCNSHGFAADENDCTVFYRCDHNRVHRFTCPGNLHFDTSLNVCNWPQDAGCSSGQSGSMMSSNNVGPVPPSYSQGSESSQTVWRPVSPQQQRIPTQTDQTQTLAPVFNPPVFNPPVFNPPVYNPPVYVQPVVQPQAQPQPQVQPQPQPPPMYVQPQFQPQVQPQPQFQPQPAPVFVQSQPQPQPQPQQQQMGSQMSAKDFFKGFNLGQQTGYQKGYSAGHSTGYNEGRNLGASSSQTLTTKGDNQQHMTTDAMGMGMGMGMGLGMGMGNGMGMGMDMMTSSQTGRAQTPRDSGKGLSGKYSKGVAKGLNKGRTSGKGESKGYDYYDYYDYGANNFEYYGYDYNPWKANQGRLQVGYSTGFGSNFPMLSQMQQLPWYLQQQKLLQQQQLMMQMQMQSMPMMLPQQQQQSTWWPQPWQKGIIPQYQSPINPWMSQPQVMLPVQPTKAAPVSGQPIVVYPLHVQPTTGSAVSTTATPGTNQPQIILINPLLPPFLPPISFGPSGSPDFTVCDDPILAQFFPFCFFKGRASTRDLNNQTRQADRSRRPLASWMRLYYGSRRQRHPTLQSALNDSPPRNCNVVPNGSTLTYTITAPNQPALPKEQCQAFSSLLRSYTTTVLERLHQPRQQESDSCVLQVPELQVQC